MNRVLTTVLFSLLLAAAAEAAIGRNPTGVNVNSQGPTTVFITFGGLDNQVAVEALWCTQLIPAAPDIGMKCRPDSILGRLPLRYDQSRTSGQSGFTDIMSIPANVSRRAWSAVSRGEALAFFYVRRFASTTGGPDEYVFVTCRLAGTGARTPLSLLDVELGFAGDAPVLSVRPGEPPPSIEAVLTYTGTGRLIGRWEVVLPGDEPPTAFDRLTAASLPVEQRPLQRRFTEVERFNVFLPPTGSHRLPGPDPRKLPSGVEGLYQLLLRIEASDDKEAESNLAAAGAGQGVVQAGGAAGFPLPVLRYYVGAISSDGLLVVPDRVALLTPAVDAMFDKPARIEFTWSEQSHVSYYRLLLLSSSGERLLSAVVQSGTGRYRAPSWLGDRMEPGRYRWRVVELRPDGSAGAATEWRSLYVRQQ